MSQTLCQQALLIFADDKTKVSSFYQCVLGLDVIESTSSYELLSGHGCEIFVHSASVSESSSGGDESKPAPRIDTSLKPIFTVFDLEGIRDVAVHTGGFLLPPEQAWKYRNFLVLDGWDPEGNVVQFRQKLKATLES